MWMGHGRQHLRERIEPIGLFGLSIAVEAF